MGFSQSQTASLQGPRFYVSLLLFFLRSPLVSRRNGTGHVHRARARRRHRHSGQRDGDALRRRARPGDLYRE